MRLGFLPSLVVILLHALERAAAITCYECQSSQGHDCKYAAKSCEYGLFGCVKIAVYNGGVDKMGMWYNEERRIISMLRGCSVLPFGGEDDCQQTSIFGARVVTCYCFNDYCNSSSTQFCTLLICLLVTLFLQFRH